MGRVVYLLSCTKSKNKDAGTVEELYTGQLFRKGLEYARRQNPDAILVIGGVCKSDIILLNDAMSYYDGIALERLRVAERKKLAQIRLDNILARGFSAEDDTFVFLTGQHYYEFILAGRRNALPGALQHYETPFLDNHLHGIGEILHFLDIN